MHAVDYENCVKANTCPNLAALGTTGSKLYPHIHVAPLGFVPRADGSGHRRNAEVRRRILRRRLGSRPGAAGNTTGNGLAGGTCTPGANNGTQTEYEEGVEINQLLLNGGGPYASVIDGGVLSIDPTRLVARSVLQADRLRSGLSLELHPHQHDLRRNSCGRRLHCLVGQARRLCGGFRPHRNRRAEQRGRLLFAGSQFQSDPLAGRHHRRHELRLLNHPGERERNSSRERLDDRFSGHPVL